MFESRIWKIFSISFQVISNLSWTSIQQCPENCLYPYKETGHVTHKCPHHNSIQPSLSTNRLWTTPGFHSIICLKFTSSSCDKWTTSWRFKQARPTRKLREYIFNHHISATFVSSNMFLQLEKINLVYKENGLIFRGLKGQNILNINLMKIYIQNMHK